MLRLGATVGEAGPGPHFKVPWIDSVRKITVQNQNRRYQALEAYSRDQQPANLTVSVTFVVWDPSAIYEQYGDLEGAVKRLIDRGSCRGSNRSSARTTPCARFKSASR